eukprot:11920846-Alexandrium_andersonii.AAC.1
MRQVCCSPSWSARGATSAPCTRNASNLTRRPPSSERTTCTAGREKPRSKAFMRSTSMRMSVAVSLSSPPLMA